jgi:hypothetical protein
VSRERVALVLGLGTALALGGCQTSQAPSTTAIGFEGFIGVPQPVGEQVARELVRAADGRRFTLVPAQDASARFVMRGYLAPAAQGGGVAYMWDLFDRAGQRAHRLSGDLPLPPGDPWAALSSDAARPLAVASAGAIDAFVQRPAQPVPAATQAAASPGSAQTQPTPQATPSLPSPEAARPQAGRRITVEAVSGLDTAEAGQLAAAMRRVLGELGYSVQQPGARADVVLSAEVTLNPVQREARFFSITWHVADGSGRTLGEIRQMARLPEQALARGTGPTFTRAVESALPGLVALAPPREEARDRR